METQFVITFTPVKKYTGAPIAVTTNATDPNFTLELFGGYIPTYSIQTLTVPDTPNFTATITYKNVCGQTKTVNATLTQSVDINGLYYTSFALNNACPKKQATITVTYAALA